MSILFKFVLLAIIAGSVSAEKMSKTARKRSTEAQVQQIQPQLVQTQQQQQIEQQQQQQQQFQNIEPEAAASGKSLENANIYASPDLIQQYAGQYNPALATYFGPYPDASNGAFSVQSGYNGYVIPEYPRQSTALVETESEPGFNPFEAISGFIPSLRTVMSIGGRFFSVLLGFLGVTAVGGGITTAICTYTPLCTISFALPLLGLGRSVAKDIIAENVNPEIAKQVSDTAEMVANALKSFTKAQEAMKSPIADIQENEITNETKQ